eukprot:CAMPEP_0173121124 /NCGR_PEP_ID=MMETSP1102-20130122/53066_1 /TAXON_ID=49646 /ORGANISM="Geminigera sp., Strain Caron Lab Isolate" /LENGTH=138 /DNA_ID=CAMNT_0014027605 /DNA_START=91 /DNA_END=505 /DNA_ORIENTATION=-
MHFTEGKRARDKECDKESDAADDAAKTKDGFGRKVHSFGVKCIHLVWCWSAFIWCGAGAVRVRDCLFVDDTQIAEEEEEHVPLFMTEIDTASYRGITTRDIELLQRELSSYYNAQTHGEQLNLLQARMQGMKVKDDSK